MNEFDFRIEGRVAKIVLDRPDSQNLLSRDLLLSLRTVARDLAANPDIQVLTIVGKGTECFSTGILTPALRGQLAKEDVLKLIRLANETFDAIEALPQIVIAGLNGYVRAGAVELILACDIKSPAIMSGCLLPRQNGAAFQAPERRFGSRISSVPAEPSNYSVLVVKSTPPKWSGSA